MMFLQALAPYYLWIKAFHIIAVIAWMAGMLYLPRLFVYHCEAVPNSPESERFKRMELRLLRIIINPSMITVWVLGLLLVALGQLWAEPWMHLKFALVVVLSALHGFLSRCRRDFARDANTRSQRFYRMVNEVPAILMFAIVILVVVKPF
jgi:protoporphyrinogen IX oxidase